MSSKNSKQERIKLKSSLKNKSRIKNKNTKDKQRINNLKNAIHIFIHFLFIIFSILIIVYILGLFFPFVRDKVDIRKIEQIITSVFGFILGGVLKEHISNYFIKE